MVGEVAIVGVVGHEDGAHKVVADLFQALNDIGYTIRAQGSTYWNGEAMQSKAHNDLDAVPEGGIRDGRSGAPRRPSGGRVQVPSTSPQGWL